VELAVMAAVILLVFLREFTELFFFYRAITLFVLHVLVNPAIMVRSAIRKVSQFVILYKKKANVIFGHSISMIWISISPDSKLSRFSSV